MKIERIMTRHTSQEIQAWLLSRLSEHLGITPTEIDIREPFRSYGLSSRDSISLSGELGEWLNEQLPPTIVWEHPTIESLTAHLGEKAEPSASQMVKADSVSSTRHLPKEPIAIIGMACRFPSGAADPESFWELLRNGVDAITEVPASRWDMTEYYDPRPAVAGKMYTRWGSFLENIDKFDPQFFNISPREAISMDPQQRLLLEVGWEALANAGQPVSQLVGTRTGVFIGVSTNDYYLLQARKLDFQNIDTYTGTGILPSIASGRLSYVLDLRGPNLAIDTACSSSLVAVHLACKSLQSGESSLALAGGVNLILSPDWTVYFSRIQAMSANGRCKTFDASADGFVRGEGCGIVVLKRLSEAIADGDPILAVIRGSAINHDGHSNGLTAPNVQAQQEVIRAALEDAGIVPSQVSYLEAHGTGTSLGDPIEIEALSTIMREGRTADNPLRIGSVKTNIGHLEAAAGIAGLMKVALALQHQEIPPHLHLNNINPLIHLESIPAAIPTQPVPWRRGSEPRIASVSAFGISGTNVHLVMEEAPKEQLPISSQETLREKAYLLPLSAHDSVALSSLVKAYAEHITKGNGKDFNFKDIVYAASARSSHFDQRLAAVASSKEELSQHLETFLQQGNCSAISQGNAVPGQQPKVVFVFPGQGSQWIGMGQQLMQSEPVFRETMEQCAQYIFKFAGWSLLHELALEEEHSHFGQIDVIQPTLFAIQVSLARLWQSWGVQPNAVVGHSMGEVAAAYIAETLSLEDAVRIICGRSYLLKRKSGQGSMVLVELPMEQVTKALAGYTDYISIAANNSPRSTVLSGGADVLKKVVAAFEKHGIFCRWIKVNVASHSPQVDSLIPELLTVLKVVLPHVSQIPIYSTVEARCCDGSSFDASYWARNLREPVLFSNAIQNLLNEGFNLFLEISPHPILLQDIEQGVNSQNVNATLLPSLRRGEDERKSVLTSLGVCYTLGCPIDWTLVYPDKGKFVQLPSYPWNRQSYWIENGSATSPTTRSSRDFAHPSLGQSRELSLRPEMRFWEINISLNTSPYLQDHCVFGKPILPATSFIDMALAAAQSLGEQRFVLKHVDFKKPLYVYKETSTTVQLVFSFEGSKGAAFQIFSRMSDSMAWTLHASGIIGLDEIPDADPTYESPNVIQSRLQKSVSGAEHYARLRTCGLEYGVSFQGLTQLWQSDGKALGLIQYPEELSLDGAFHSIHPAFMDACLQVLLATLPKSQSHTYLPVGLEKYHIYTQPGRKLWSYATLQDAKPNKHGIYKGDVVVMDDDGQLVAEARGVRLQNLETGADRASEQIRDLLYKIHWEQTEIVSGENLAKPANWLILTDGEQVGERLASLLESHGQKCLLVSPGNEYRQMSSQHFQINPSEPQEVGHLLKENFDEGLEDFCGIVHLWGLNTLSPSETTLPLLHEANKLGCTSLLYLVRAIAQGGRKNLPKLWLVTSGVHNVNIKLSSVSPVQSPIWGLGRVISNEYPQLKCKLIDINQDKSEETVTALFHELQSEDKEGQVVLRGTERFVARLVHSDSDHAVSQTNRTIEHSIVCSNGQSFRLEIPASGLLDDLKLHASQRDELAPNEVEIQVYAAGLNFMDVMKAMGIYPGQSHKSASLGNECGGKITRLGSNVTGLKTGDSVVAIAPSSMGNYVITRSEFVALKPNMLSMEAAAGIPIAFLTARYALSTLAQLQPGERVLIHSAAGGVGLAAIQIAQQVGAQIFATAGTVEKREFIKSLGVQHVFDSRSLDFAAEIMQCTDGQGVDVVLNSLTGESISKSLSVLRFLGRFIELGKHDIYQNRHIGLEPFKNNLSYFAVDLERICQERPALVSGLLHELMDFIATGQLKPLPTQIFSIANVVDAFKYMAQAGHIGKIVTLIKDQENQLVISQPRVTSIRKDGTYLITGGLGGLGLSVARWLMQKGARHLTLVGRSEPSTNARQVLTELEQAGVHITVVRADVAETGQVASLLENIQRSQPPLRGIVHAAGTIDDGTLLQMTSERLEKVLSPKIYGAWNLHTLTLNQPLDFFILFSSATSILGTPGQGNYAAANAFLDALAHYRYSLGLPALSINWGPWAEVGMAAKSELKERLAFRGLESLQPSESIATLEHLLDHSDAQVSVTHFNLRQWQQSYPTTTDEPFFDQLAQESKTSLRSNHLVNSFRETLQNSSREQRQVLIENHLREQLTQALRLRPDQIEFDQPFNRLGVDSLMALEFRNRLEMSLGLVLPAILVWKYPTISILARHLLAQMGFSDNEQSPSSVETNIDEADPLDQFSEEQIEELLAEELKAIQSLMDESEDKKQNDN